MSILLIDTAEDTIKPKDKQILQHILEVVAITVSYNQQIIKGLSLELLSACVAYLSLKKLQII